MPAPLLQSPHHSQLQHDFTDPVYILHLNSTATTPRHSLEEEEGAHLSEGIVDATDAVLVLPALDDSWQKKVIGEPPSFWEDIINSRQHKSALHDSTRLNCTDPNTSALRTTGLGHLRQRSLTDASFSSTDDEMTALASEAPGSPPGLSRSKSSKSSSYHSSSLSAVDGLVSDISHFEDIGLDEDAHPFVPIPTPMEKTSRPPPRSSTPMTSGHRHNTVPMLAMRDLTKVGLKSPPSRMMNSHSSVHSLSLPNPGPMRRGYKNASTPSLAITAMSNYTRSRSPSPNPVSPFHRPVLSPKSPQRPSLTPLEMHPAPKRRTSWQPSRKSVKELEAEYTENDEDDDLPEEASLWNVPLSPRPPTERSPKPMMASPKPSPCVSPERPSPLRTSLSVNAQDVPKTVSTKSSPSGSPSIGAPLSPRHHKLTRGASTGAMPDHYSLPNGRVKSWNVVLSELSEDAKALTETLENHALESERKHEENVQNGSVSPEPAFAKLSKSKTSITELPPLRLNNVMIDPLPISKEKEKVLTRTRPSWLPPKSQKEEKKHLREYQRMMELSREADKRRAAKDAHNQSAKDDRKGMLQHIWEEHVLPNWDQVIREPRTRELWWRGIAPKSRATVWQKGIGNELALTEVTYGKALNRAKDIEGQIAGGKSERYQMEKRWFDAIHRDVEVTCPELNIFQSGGPLHAGLIDVLMAYSMYRSDVGYSHGTHLIAALLLLTLPTHTTTFITLANLLNRPLPLAFLTGDPANTQKAYDLTLSLLYIKFPRLHAHLFGTTTNSLSISTTNAPMPTTNHPDSSTATTPTPSTSHSLNLPPHLVLEPMMRTMFLGPAGGLGVDVASRIWDVMIFDGDTAIIRTVVATLGVLEAKLYGNRSEVLNVLGWGALGVGGEIGLGIGEEEFLSKVRAVGKESPAGGANIKTSAK